MAFATKTNKNNNYSSTKSKKTASNWHTMDIRLLVNHLRQELHGVGHINFF